MADDKTQDQEQTKRERKVKIKGTEYDWPPAEDLDLAEASMITDLTGHGVAEWYTRLFTLEGPSLVAFALIVIRRSGTRISLEEARELKLGDFDLRMKEEAEDEDPQSAEGGASSTDSADSKATGSNGSSPSTRPSEDDPSESGSPRSATSSA